MTAAAKLPILAELHTTDLTATCLRSVRHRLMQEFRAEVPTAMFRGIAAGHAVQTLARGGLDQCRTAQLAREAVDSASARLAEEGWTLTDAVAANLDEIAAEIQIVVNAFDRRIMPALSECRLIGTELPVRAPWDPPFASHLDIMFRDPSGRFGPPGALHVWDFKWREEAPTIAYLARDMQLAAYFCAVLEGSVLLEEAVDHDSGWTEFAEAPVVSWVHLPALKPFARRTETVDEDGTVVVRQKGDERPVASIIRQCRFSQRTTPAAFHEEYALRAAMAKLGHWPRSPSPTGCLICPSEPWCRRMDIDDPATTAPSKETA